MVLLRGIPLWIFLLTMAISLVAIYTYYFISFYVKKWWRRLISEKQKDYKKIKLRSDEFMIVDTDFVRNRFGDDFIANRKHADEYDLKRAEQNALYLYIRHEGNSYVTSPILISKEDLILKLGNHKRISVYQNTSDPNDYSFDLGFLF